MPFRNRDEFFNAYTESVSEAIIKVVPIVRSGGTDWTIRLFLKDRQGPLFEVKNLTAEELEQALNADFEEIDIDRDRIEQINRARQWADKFLRYESSYNRKERGDAPMEKLIYLSSMGQVSEWQNPVYRI